MEDRRAFLGSGLGAGLHPRDLARMLSEGYARVRVWSAGSLIAMAAQPQRDFMIVLDGRVEVTRILADGSRHIIDVVGPGGACGAVTAFAPRPRWPASVLAVTEVRALSMEQGALLTDQALDQTRTRLLQNCTRLVAGRARHLNSRVELLTRRGLRERLAFYLVSQADDEGQVRLALSRQELADTLFVSRASMTRELGRLADDGLLRIHGRSFQLLDIDALRTLMS